MHGNLHFLFLSRLLYVICVKISIIMERTRIILNNNIQTGLSKSSRLPSKIAAYLVRIGRVLCLAFLYRWCFLNKISLDWLFTLTTHPSTSKISDNPDTEWGQLQCQLLLHCSCNKYELQINMHLAVEKGSFACKFNSGCQLRTRDQ